MFFVDKLIASSLKFDRGVFNEFIKISAKFCEKYFLFTRLLNITDAIKASLAIVEKGVVPNFWQSSKSCSAVEIKVEYVFCKNSI